MKTLFFIFWALAGLAFPLFVIVALWLAIPSGMLLRVHDMVHDPVTGNTTLTRTVMSKRDLIARWHVSVSDGDRECGATGFDIYEPKMLNGTPKTVAIFPTSPSLLPCLQAENPVIVASWQVLYWGFIPLRETFFFKPPRVAD